MLACAGREVFLKTVIQAIPLYSMSCFKLTKKVCKSFSSITGRYWWSSSLDRKSVHWVSWKDLAKPKVKGGMGFRDLELFNVSLLGKHGWRLMTNPSSLCARVLKDRYYPHSEFLQATIPARSSATWRAIVAGREALQLGLLKRIGSGRSVNVWQDAWIPGTISMRPAAHIGREEIVFVSDLIDDENGMWKVDKIRRNFIVPDADSILNIPLRRGGGEDFWAWNHEKTGVLQRLQDVKSA
jgi:hypothetical protein